MNTEKERITTYVDDATAYEIKKLSECAGTSMSKILAHAIAKMAYLKNMSQNDTIDKLTKQIFIAFGFQAKEKGKKKIEIDNNGEKIELAVDGNAGDIAKRIVQLQKKLSAEALKVNGQTSTKLLLALPLIAQEVKIYGTEKKDSKKGI